ncbi:hypothetical protein ABAC460_01940 [Asticcacaulis sp. AC460]|uniref:YoaK family protein n=1 Tax=Asticcacaulis sp. AC460 TaxID=1282360 RepID=UPI0003C3AF94|nr:YoaK family protein [Asticcacaulis sp. AC460]ESQ93039.1 hypothetical protein ABAC460_01940 [Asticcacaulis sp. AC460]
MTRLNNHVIVLAVGLSALAGFVDVLGFLELHGRFVAFMSGNSTLLALAMARQDVMALSIAGGIILTFVTGTFVATLIAHFVPRHLHIRVVLWLVAGLLLAGFFSHLAGWPVVAIAGMTLAMGAANAVLQRDGEVVVGVTYMTGTLVKIGQKAAQGLTGGARFAWLPYLLLWAGLVAGGIIGVLIYDKAGLNGLAIAAVWAAILSHYAVWLRIAIPSEAARDS